mgnify:CR=1 FL=1
MGAMQSVRLPDDIDNWTVVPPDAVDEEVVAFHNKREPKPIQYRMRDLNGVIDIYVQARPDWWYHWRKCPGEGQFHLCG